MTDAELQAIREEAEKELWPGTGYWITRDGRVVSRASNWRGYGPRELKQSPNRCGYPSVRL